MVIYGDIVKSTHHNGSDIDLTIIDKNFDLKLQNNIENSLEDLMLPYNIDLLILSKIENSDLVDHIKRVRQNFFIKSLKYIYGNKSIKWYFL